MKKVIYSILSLTAVLSTVSCQQQMPLAARNLQTFRAQQPTGQTRSNAGLDAVSKRMRHVLFQSADRNRDNQISPQEYTYGAIHIPTYDKNKDGQLNFQEFDTALIKLKAYGLNRESLRFQAQSMWNQINKDNNQVLLREEVETFFMAPYNQPMPMPMPPMPSALPSTMPDPAFSEPGGYNPNPVSSGYPDPYAGMPNYEQLKYEARRQAIDFFVQTDLNLDQKLTFSEYEDGYAKQLLSTNENTLSNGYGGYYPGYGSGYGAGYGSGYGTGYGSAYGATPAR